MRLSLSFALAAVFLGGAGHGALALDCARASAPLEKAICADPAAQAADDGMGKAYAALAASLSPAHRGALIISQRRWIELRGNLCSGEKDQGDAACALKMTREREAFLSGRPESGPGAPPGFAALFVQHVGKDGEYDIGVDALKYVDPARKGEAAFNARIDKLLKDAPAIRDKDIPKDRTYTYFLDVAATYASDKFVSAKAFVYEYSGGAHGNSGTSAFAFDVASGRELKFDDMFAAGARTRLVDGCFAQIEAQRREKGGDDDPSGPFGPDAIKKSVGEGVADLSQWSFYADRGAVNFDPYAVGSYAEGSYSCEFPLDVLKPLLKYDYVSP